LLGSALSHFIAASGWLVTPFGKGLSSADQSFLQTVFGVLALESEPVDPRL
jgi:hypothetical protein